MKSLLILAVLSILVHTPFFGQPSAVVFDEVYTGTFVSSYESGKYYFDIHPPLAKLVTKFFGDLVGVPYTVDFGTIGNTLPSDILLLRLLPLLAGILLPLVIYGICRRLNISKLLSFTTGSLLCLENSLIMQSRFILFDSWLLLCGFSAILLYLFYIKNESKKSLLVLSALFASCAFSIKWTGLAFPLLILIAEIVRTRYIFKILKFFAVYAFIGLAFYMSIFAIHFAYLTHSGPGDAFMTDRFQKTLVGSQYEKSDLVPKGFFGKFIELNVEMYEANKTLTATHPYSSPWYAWPLMLRSVFYWQGSSNIEGNAYLYLLGNPLIYWLGTLSIIFLMWQIFIKRSYDKVSLFILTGFLVNFLPFMFIGRVMFLYHYEAALVFSIIALCFIVDKLVPEKMKELVVAILLGICIALFIFFSPLTYGRNLTDEQLSARMWLKGWR
jgi:dolichyl-phosphate-mannose-protein mannosyltransferase